MKIIYVLVTVKITLATVPKLVPDKASHREIGVDYRCDFKVGAGGPGATY